MRVRDLQYPPSDTAVSLGFVRFLAPEHFRYDHDYPERCELCPTVHSLDEEIPEGWGIVDDSPLDCGDKVIWSGDIIARFEI